MSHYNIETLRNNFTYHPPKVDQIATYKRLRDIGMGMAKFILFNCPDSDDRTLAIRSVEEAVMRANASIARSEDPYKEADPSDLPAAERHDRIIKDALAGDRGDGAVQPSGTQSTDWSNLSDGEQ